MFILSRRHCIPIRCSNPSLDGIESINVLKAIHKNDEFNIDGLDLRHEHVR